MRTLDVRRLLTCACALSLLSACATVTEPDRPAPSASSSASAAAGTCASLRSGPGPDPIAGIADLSWAAAEPAATGVRAYFFSSPMRSGEPSKVLWVSDRTGELSIAASPVGTTTAVVTVDVPPADDSPFEYPSFITLPDPGCWTLGVQHAGVRGEVRADVLPGNGD